jgi:hypothetical protein
MSTLTQSPIDVRHGPPGGLRARARAAGIHLLLSACIACTVSACVLGFGYPSPFLYASGGLSLIAMIVAVDVVTGPALTFAVFNRAKKELRRDLAVIGLLQVAALVYGLHATILGRPVFITFVVDRFELVSAAEVDAEELAKAPESMRTLSWGTPTLAAAVPPTDPAEREQLLFASMQGIDLKHLMRRYVDYASMRDPVLARARPIDDLVRFNAPAAVEQALSAYRGAGPMKYLPVQGRREDLCALVGAGDARLIAVVRLRPWE